MLRVITGHICVSGANYTIALRLAGGGSFGQNPQKFIIGGVDNWINRSFSGGYIPLVNAEDFIFLETGLPLRGYDYNAEIGSRYGLFNFELRYPLFAFLQAGPLPIGLQSIGGVMFFDMGSAWSKERDFVAFTRDEAGNLVTRDLLMGMGTGARIVFLAFLVRFDVAWAWNVNRVLGAKVLHFSRNRLLGCTARTVEPPRYACMEMKKHPEAIGPGCSPDCRNAYFASVLLSAGFAFEAFLELFFASGLLGLLLGLLRGLFRGLLRHLHRRRLALFWSFCAVLCKGAPAKGGESKKNEANIMNRFMEPPPNVCVRVITAVLPLFLVRNTS